MAITLEQFGLDQLPLTDRVELARLLWASIEAQAPPGSLMTREEQMAELRRRCEEMDADPDGGIPWEEVKAKARARFKKD